MSSIFVRTASVAALVIGLGACAVDEDGDDLEGDELDTGQVQQGIAGCHLWGCGMNSSEVGGMDWINAAEDGSVSDGFSITLVKHPSYPLRTFRLDVAKGRLTARTNDGGALIVISGFTVPSVQGLRIEAKNAHSGQVFTLRVGRVNNQVAFWNWLYPGFTSSYRIEYRPGPLTLNPEERFPTNLCSNPLPDGDMGMNGFDTVVTEGHHVDGLKKRVDEDASTKASLKDHFTWGCAGHALAKMHLTRVAWATQAGGTDTKKQTAFVKLVTADYCGTGKAFTAQGENMVFRDNTLALQFFPVLPAAAEARWNANGAVCMDKPRLIDTMNPLALAEWPDIMGAIKNECGGVLPKECTGYDPVIAYEDPMVDVPGLTFVTGDY